MKILNHPLFVATVIVFLIAEYFISRRKDLSNFNGYEAFSNLVLISLDKIIALVTGADGSGAGSWLWQFRVFELDFSPPVNFMLTFMATEFMYYWNHWYNHHVNIGWATHIMHHSPTKFNFTIGYRLGITRFFSLGWLIFLPLVILGFHPNDIALSVGIMFLFQFFIHTELVPRLGWLDKIFNTPSNHRIHHSSNPKHYNKNLGGTLMLFDHIFGTYQAEEKDAKMTYGIPRIMIKKSIWYEITCHWSKVFKQFKEARGMKGKVIAVFGSSAQGQKA